MRIYLSHSLEVNAASSDHASSYARVDIRHARDCYPPPLCEGDTSEAHEYEGCEDGDEFDEDEYG